MSTTTRFVPFAAPSITQAEIDSVVEVLRSGWISTGERAAAFEQAFSKYVGTRYAIALNSCTAALHLALAGLPLASGDEVITSTWTFSATAAAIVHAGGRPVLVDVRRDDLNVDPAAVAAAITERTRAIIPVHFAGRAADINAIRRIADPRGIAVIEDAAHALPTRYRGRMAGQLGTASCFSFFATKTITTAEGGMLCTDDEELADRARTLSLHGLSRGAADRYTEKGSPHYDVTSAGFKYNMPDTVAALGQAQLTRSNELWTRRRLIAERYFEAFADQPEIELPATDDEQNESAWYLYVIRLHLDRLRIARDEFIAQMKDRGVGTSIHFHPLHTFSYYRESLNMRPEDCPVAHAEWQRCISLPIFPAMSDEDVEHVVAVVRDVCQAYGLAR